MPRTYLSTAMLANQHGIAWQSVLHRAAADPDRWGPDVVVGGVRGWRPERLDDPTASVPEASEYLGVTDVTQRLHVEPWRLRNWMRRHEDFPQPVVVVVDTGEKRHWGWEETQLPAIRDWSQERTKRPWLASLRPGGLSDEALVRLGAHVVMGSMTWQQLGEESAMTKSGARARYRRLTSDGKR